MGGGLPAAAFGGRAEIMCQLAPAGPVYQAGTLSGNPLACAAGLATLRACTDERLRRGSTRPPRRSASWPPRRWPRPGVPHRLQTAGNMFSIFFTDADGDRLRRRAKTQDVGRVPGVLPRDAGRAASTCRRSAFEAWFVSTAIDDDGAGASSRRPCRTPPRRRGQAAEGGARDRADDRRARAAARRGPQPGRRSCTAGCPGSGSPSWASRWPRRPPQALADRDITYVVASPLERAQQTAEPIAAQFGLPIAVDERLIESANFFEGKRVASATARCATRATGGCCATRSRRRGASRTGRSPQRMYAALQAARERGRGARGGLRLAPAADLDPAPVPRAQAALARPAQAAVRPGQPHQLPLRRHEARRHRLRRAGRAPGRAVAERPYGQGRLTCAARAARRGRVALRAMIAAAGCSTGRTRSTR